MKKIISTLLIVACLLALSCSFTSCGERQKADLTTIQSLSDLENLSGVILAAQKGTFHLDALNEQVSDNVEKKEYEDFPTLLIALQSGAIDGYIAEEPTAITECLQNQDLTYVALQNNDTGFEATADEVGIAIALKKGSTLKEEMNQVLATISDSTKAALMEQACRMAESKDTALGEPLALESSKTSTSRGTLRVAMECGYDPFNWTQQTDANGAVPIEGQNGFYANGYDVQIAKYVAQELGFELVIVANNWDSLIASCKAGTVDAIIAGMSPTAERQLEVDFTDCYYSSNLVIVIKKAV